MGEVGMTPDELDDRDWSLLARYFSGVCSPEEEQAVEQWIATQPGRRREVDLLRAAWEQAARLPPDGKAGQAFRRVATRVGLVNIDAGPDRTSSRSRRSIRMALPASRRRWMSLIAATAAAITIVVSAWLLGKRARDSSSEGRSREYVTQPAQHAEIEFSDGTRVTLGAASRLTVPSDFGTRERTVTLEGEAYFVVAPDVRRPFRVRTATTVTEDLGTIFLVRMHPRDSVVDAVVFEGAVALRPDGGTGQGVKLSRGQLGRVERSGLVTVRHDVDLAAWRGWMEGRLEFHKTPLVDVREALERWYGVRIEFPDSTLTHVPVSASFSGQPVDQALKTLARLLGLSYERYGSAARLLPVREVNPLP